MVRSAAEALGRIGDARAVDPLIAALRDEDIYVVRSAAEALGRIGDARAVDPLIAALRDEDVVRSAAEALGRIGDARAVDALIDTLRKFFHYSADANHKSAADALVQIGAPAVDALVAAVHRALHEMDLNRCESAANTLHRIGDAGALRLIDTLRGAAEWRFLDAQEKYEAWERYDAAYMEYDYKLHDPSDAQQAAGVGYPPDPPDFPRPSPPNRDDYRRRYASCPLCQN